MSAAVGIFTRAFGGVLGPVGELFPLPVREQGSANIGKGRAAGHRVQLADWAYIIEAAEQRATWANLSTMYTVRHDVYPHNYAQRLYDDQDAETYNTEGVLQSPSVAAWQRVASLNSNRFLRPDSMPAAQTDGWWNFGGEGNDRAGYVYQFASPYGSAPGDHLRNVDDVRRLFYDVKNCTRAGNYAGTFLPYDNGVRAGADAPRYDIIGGGSSQRYEADEFRNVGIGFNLHHEVLAHADFSLAPAYAIIQLRMTQSRNSVVLRNYGRYVRAAWTYNAATATASVNLAACGCDTDSVAAWMASASGGFVNGDLYIGTARLVELAYDLTLPIDRGLYLGWTWTPNAA